MQVPAEVLVAPMQMVDMPCTPVVQGDPGPHSDDASLTVGATILVTRGTLTAAVHPNRRIISRRDSHAPLCRRGSLRIIAAITHEAVITRLLHHCKLASVPPPIAPARSRQETFDWVA